MEHRRRERSLLDLVDTLKTLEKEIETRTLTMNALKRAKNQGKNRSKMIQRRIESIFAIETDIVSSPASFCLLNQPLIDLDRAIYIYIYFSMHDRESYNECF